MSEIKVLMPQMGESINEGTLNTWNKKEGESVEAEEILFEISTDKVDTEVPSPASGTLVKILAQEGDTVAVDSVVAIINTEGAGKATDSSSSSSASSSSSQKSTPPAAPKSSDTSSSSLSSDGKRIATPVAEKVAAEHNVDLSAVSGTGEKGRITKGDVLTHVQSSSASSQGSAPVTAATPKSSTPASSTKSSSGAPGPDVVDGVRVDRVPMTTMRRKIAEHMVTSKHTSPHVTSVIEIDMQKVVDLRAKYKSQFEKQNGYKLTFTHFFMQAAVNALKAVPIANSSVEGSSILYKKDVNLGMAVAVEKGLIVPVIKNAQDLSFGGLARGLDDIVTRARKNKLSPDDMRGGTFTISNYGGFGTIIGQPIINQPQVAIMGIGAMTKKPVIVNDAIAVRTMVYVVLSFDHRVMDGKDSGLFLSTVKETLENWTLPVV